MHQPIDPEDLPSEPLHPADIACSKCGHHLSIAPWIAMQRTPTDIIFKCECGHLQHIQRTDKIASEDEGQSAA